MNFNFTQEFLKSEKLRIEILISLFFFLYFFLLIRLHSDTILLFSLNLPHSEAKIIEPNYMSEGSIKGIVKPGKVNKLV